MCKELEASGNVTSHVHLSKINVYERRWWLDLKEGIFVVSCVCSRLKCRDDLEWAWSLRNLLPRRGYMQVKKQENEVLWSGRYTVPFEPHFSVTL